MDKKHLNGSIWLTINSLTVCRRVLLTFLYYDTNENLFCIQEEVIAMPKTCVFHSNLENKVLFYIIENWKVLKPPENNIQKAFLFIYLDW